MHLQVNCGITKNYRTFYAIFVLESGSALRIAQCNILLALFHSLTSFFGFRQHKLCMDRPILYVKSLKHISVSRSSSREKCRQVKQARTMPTDGRKEHISRELLTYSVCINRLS
jgi:hypothetical protein